jgi:hypothetical protein
VVNREDVERRAYDATEEDRGCWMVARIAPEDIDGLVGNEVGEERYVPLGSCASKSSASVS